MADFQQQKSLVLSFYSELEKASSETIDQVLAENLVPDFHWYGVHPFGEQEGTEAVAHEILAASAEIMDPGAAKAGYLLCRDQ